MVNFKHAFKCFMELGLQAQLLRYLDAYLPFKIMRVRLLNNHENLDLSPEIWIQVLSLNLLVIMYVCSYAQGSYSQNACVLHTDRQHPFK